MKHLIAFLTFMATTLPALSQEIIELPHEKAENLDWTTKERQYHSEIWDTEVVSNVATPTLEVFRPKRPNGTAVIIAPGGGLYALSIESEGKLVAEWLARAKALPPLS